MTPPHGLEEAIKVYGDYRIYLRSDGTLAPEWEWHTLGICPLPAGLPLSWEPSREIHKIRCHRLLVPIFKAVFESIHAAGLWDQLEDFGGCYAPRAQRGSSKPSLHIWGAAVDLNTNSNPLGEVPKMPGGIVQLFEAHGFEWGGRWERQDGMHHQFATGF